MRTRLIGSIAGLAVLALAGTMVSADAKTGPKPKITAKGVGKVKLGATYKSLRRAHLIGKLHVGCPLAGPEPGTAALRPPLKGSVNFAPKAPRRATGIVVTGGATARGVKIGSTLKKLRKAYPKAQVNNATKKLLGIVLVTIPKNGGGDLQFALTKRNKVKQIGIPLIPLCD